MTITVLQAGLQQALAHLARMDDPSDIRPLVLFLSGPSLLVPKSLLGVRLPSGVDGEETRQAAGRWDGMERKMLKEVFARRLGKG